MQKRIYPYSTDQTIPENELAYNDRYFPLGWTIFIPES